MSDRFEKFEGNQGDGAIPAYFEGRDVPHGTLNRYQVVLQSTDHWFSEIDDCWKPVEVGKVGLWADEVFGPHVTVYGYLPRFSDAIHPERFLFKYGRSKPERISDWPNLGFDRSGIDD